ncbi:NAD(P)-dependent oxidoreductase [Hydrogenophaga sp. BPS33]|uniref:NAD(P)-dependent oxidoreductase n=1 Tax=Hydrogenophaga sp. BPS33 TaxID=2651974 RepID=UPI001357D751|nr:NAD(P)-dependent oxidoreductase [Hydrogenophaga sp. BPS33]
MVDTEDLRVKKAARPVGFIGLGAMGKPMALCLLKADIPVIVYDRDAARVDQLCTAGAEAATSSMELAKRCDRMVCIVETAAQVREVMFGERGIKAGASEGHQVLVMSTIDPDALRKMAEESAASGITLRDAPVSGSTEGAINGTLTFFVGGSEQDGQAFADCFAAMGTHVFYMGALTKGIEIKLLNNMLAQVNTVAVAEALAMASKAGMDLKTVIEAVKVSTGNSAIFELRAPRILARNFAPGGSNDISYKDQELQTAFAKRLGVPVFLPSITQQVYQIARSMNLGKEDGSSIIKVYEALSGMDRQA